MSDVHTRHCCPVHGCKYAAWNVRCTVFHYGEPTDFPHNNGCEQCEAEIADLDHALRNLDRRREFNPEEFEQFKRDHSPLIEAIKRLARDV